MNQKIVKVIENYYRNNEVKFTLGSIQTGWMTNNVGVRQGCVMSPTLFNIYLEELLVRIRLSGRGIKIGSDRLVGCLAYADDVVLMSENKAEMDEMLQIVNQYGKEWGLKFSPHKCKVMQFGDDVNNQWVLGDYVLEVVKYTSGNASEW